MKNLLTSLVVFAVLGTATTTHAQSHKRQAQHSAHEHTAPAGVFDHKTVEEAWKVAVEKQKPLLVMFTSNNCTFCRKMIADTYRNQNVKELLRGRTESVMAHSDHYASLIKKLGIRGYPSSLLISPEGEVLDFMEGYVDADEFAKRVGPLLDRPATQLGMNVNKQTVEH